MNQSPNSFEIQDIANKIGVLSRRQDSLEKKQKKKPSWGLPDVDPELAGVLSVMVAAMLAIANVCLIVWAKASKDDVSLLGDMANRFFDVGAAWVAVKRMGGSSDGK